MKSTRVNLIPLATEVEEGNVFRGVCQSFCRRTGGGGQGGMSIQPGHGTCHIRLASGRYTSYWNAFLLQIMSSWCVVLISSERFVAVWIPNKAKNINTKRNIAAAIASLFLFFTCYIGYWTNFADKIIKGYVFGGLIPVT